MTHATRKSEFSASRLGRVIMFIYEAARIEVVGIVSASRRFDTFNREFSIPFPSRRRRLIDFLAELSQAHNKDASRGDRSGVSSIDSYLEEE